MVVFLGMSSSASYDSNSSYSTRTYQIFGSMPDGGGQLPFPVPAPMGKKTSCSLLVAVGIMGLLAVVFGGLWYSGTGVGDLFKCKCLPE